MSGYMNRVNDEFKKFVYSQVLPCIGVYTLYLILHGWVLGSEGTISFCNIAKRVTILCTDHQQMTAILPTARHIDTKNNLWEYTFLKIDGKTHSNNNSFWQIYL
jgi:hypothetical protein